MATTGVSSSPVDPAAGATLPQSTATLPAADPTIPPVSSSALIPTLAMPLTTHTPPPQLVSMPSDTLNFFTNTLQGIQNQLSVLNFQVGDLATRVAVIDGRELASAQHLPQVALPGFGSMPALTAPSAIFGARVDTPCASGIFGARSNNNGFPVLWLGAADVRCTNSGGANQSDPLPGFTVSDPFTGDNPEGRTSHVLSSDGITVTTCQRVPGTGWSRRPQVPQAYVSHL